jgi:hypothetical protein
MPRKKTMQPLPLCSFSLLDRTLVEVRGDGYWEIGRGQHKVIEYEKKRDEVLERVVNDYLTKAGRKAVTPDYLDTGRKFARQCERWAFGDVDGLDDSSLRKKLYKDILKNISILESSIEASKAQEN